MKKIIYDKLKNSYAKNTSVDARVLGDYVNELSAFDSNFKDSREDVEKVDN